MVGENVEYYGTEAKKSNNMLTRLDELFLSIYYWYKSF